MNYVKKQIDVDCMFGISVNGSCSYALIRTNNN